MASVNCSIIGQAYGTQGASVNYGTAAAGYAGFNYSDWYPYILKFTAPAFIGKSKSLKVNLSLSDGSRNGAASATVSLRYALCTSDANFSSYDNTTAVVTDKNQIVSGRTSFTGLTSAYATKTLTIPTSALEAGTTYYLILWGDNTGGYQQDYAVVNSAANHSITLEYNSGLVYIDSGSGLEPYQAYIDNGTSWDLYLPYVDNGSSWDLCN